MNKKQIERYFQLLAKAYPKKCWVILTGAAAGALYGRIRPTLDIDFQARAERWQEFSEAVRKVSERTGIAAQFAENIDHWSMITLADYSKHTHVYKKFGGVEVRLMEPPYWAIGKLSRYLDPDIQDLAKVFKKTGTGWHRVAAVAGKCLAKSPRSTASFQFRKQVEHFFLKEGRKVWGKAFKANEAISVFHSHAGIKS